MITATNTKLRQFDQVVEILEKNNNDKTRLITILQQVQEVYRFFYHHRCLLM